MIRFALSAVATLAAFHAVTAAAIAKPESDLANLALCAIAPDAWSRLGNDEGSPDQIKQAEARAATIKLVTTKQRIACSNGTITLWTKRSTHWIDGFGFSEDGRYAAVEGGWGGAPLLGSGGTCVYQLEQESWMRIACFNTWSN